MPALDDFQQSRHGRRAGLPRAVEIVRCIRQLETGAHFCSGPIVSSDLASTGPVRRRGTGDKHVGDDDWADTCIRPSHVYPAPTVSAWPPVSASDSGSPAFAGRCGGCFAQASAGGPGPPAIVDVIRFSDSGQARNHSPAGPAVF